MIKNAKMLHKVPEPLVVQIRGFFAKIVEPNNPKLKKRIIETKKKLNQNHPIPPSTIQLELETNPFLRCHQKSVQKRVQEYCGYPLADVIAVFAALRCWKNEF